MSETVEALIRDMLAWIGEGPGGARPYAEVIEAWRTSCPRLTVWEEAQDRGLVQRLSTNGQSLVRLTSAGRALLRQRALKPVADV